MHCFISEGRTRDKDCEKMKLTKKQSNVLNQIVLSRTHRPDHIERANIILFSSESRQDKDIGQELGIVPRTVRKWRKRWLANEAKLLLLDDREKGSTIFGNYWKFSVIMNAPVLHVHIPPNKFAKSSVLLANGRKIVICRLAIEGT